jgi:hypothetical protein
MMNQFDENTCAVGCNALVLDGDVETNRALMASKSDYFAKNPTEVALPYFNSTLWHAAFPSYIYNSKKIMGCKMLTKHGGKYCDATFLMNISHRGHIRMLATPHMFYRIHPSSGSSSRTLKDYHSLINYVAKNTTIKNKTLKIYLYSFTLKWALERYKTKQLNFNKRERTLIKAAIFYTISHPELLLKKIRTYFHLFKNRV